MLNEATDIAQRVEEERRCFARGAALCDVPIGGIRLIRIGSMLRIGCIGSILNGVINRYISFVFNESIKKST